MFRKLLLLATTSLVGLGAALVATPADAAMGVSRFVAPIEGATVAAGFRGPITVDMPTSSLIFTVECGDPRGDRTYNLASRITGGPGLATRYLDDPIANPQLSYCTAEVGDEQGNYRATLHFQVSPDPLYRPNSIWSPGGQLPDSCATVPVWFSFDRPYGGTASWDINLDVYAPNGSWSDSDYGYGPEGGDSVEGLLHAYICRYEGAGLYTMKATINWYDWHGDRMAPSSVTGSFVMTSPPTPTPTPMPVPTPLPTPVPTPPAPTYVKPNAHVRSTIDSGGIRLVMFTGSIPSGTIAKVTTWRILVDGKWVTTERQRSNDHDTWSKRFKDHTGTHRIVVTKNGWHFKTYEVNTGS